MNFIITDHCNRNCPYCFGRGKLALSDGGARARFMTFSDFEYGLDFLGRSGIPELKILGGEPTLHPDFRRMVKTAIGRQLHVTVFSNGLWPDDVADFVARIQSPALSFVFNINEPKLQPASENERQARSLGVCPAQSMVGFNIYRKEFDLRFVADLIDRHGLKREVRLGVAHPIAEQDNVFVADADLPYLGKRLLKQMECLEKQDILVALDCGFPLCMFPEEMFGQLVICAKPGPYSMCGPIIDVGPDLTTWPCFPLSGLLNVNLREFKTQANLVQHYDAKLSGIRSMGFLDKCMDCRFRIRGQCCSGCVARTLRNWQASGDRHLLEKLK